MDLYARVDLAKPSPLMMKQIILEIIDEVNSRHKLEKAPMAYAWLLDGTRVKTLMDIHPECRILVVSRNKTFEGIRGLEKLDGFSQIQLSATKKVEPKPSTWI